MNLDAERARLLGLAENASPGPWKACKPERRAFLKWSVLPHRPDIKPPFTPVPVCECDLDEEADKHNAVFIAAAHDMAALIRAQAAELERLRAAASDEVEAWLFECRGPGVMAHVTASVFEDDKCWWPQDRWTLVKRTALVKRGETVTLYDAAIAAERKGAGS